MWGLHRELLERNASALSGSVTWVFTDGIFREHPLGFASRHSTSSSSHFVPPHRLLLRKLTLPPREPGKQSSGLDVVSVRLLVIDLNSLIYLKFGGSTRVL